MTTGVPSTNTSRWAWTWFVRNSFGWGFRPAATVLSIGSDGAGQATAAADRAAELAGEPAAGLLADGRADDRGAGDDAAGVAPHPAATRTRPATTLERRSPW